MVEAKIDTDKKILFLLIFLLLIGGIIGTYAYFSSKSDSTSQDVSTATLSLIFENDSPIINGENIIPIYDEEIFERATKKNFTIKNTGTADITAKIDLTNIEITEALKSADFKWALYEGENKITDGTFENINDNKINITNNLIIKEGKSVTYDLYIWITYEDKPQNFLQNGHLTTAISVVGVQ